MEEKEIKQSKNKKQLVLSVVGVLTLVIAVVGISFAAWNYVFNGTLVNTISTNDISLDLLESNENIINIQNALPMSDNEGKAQTETFDFAVTSKTTKDTRIGYTVSIQKLDVDTGYTTIADNQIKVYLTDYSGTQLVAPTLISNLTNYQLYKGTHTHNSTTETIQDKFKLRAWIDGNVDASSWNAETKLQYKFKIGLTSEEKEPSAYPEYVYSIGQTVEIGDPIGGLRRGYCIVGTLQGEAYNSCTDENYGLGELPVCQQEISSYVSGGYIQEGDMTCEPGSWTQSGVEYTTDYTTLNRNVFLKHNISDEGTVESSELCFINNNNLYCLKSGGATYDSENNFYNHDSIYYAENVNTLQNAFGSNACRVETNDTKCPIDEYPQFYVGRNGEVGAYREAPGTETSDVDCGLYPDGFASC